MVENIIQTRRGISEKISNVSSSEAKDIEKALYALRYTNFRRLESVKKLYPIKYHEKDIKVYGYRINNYMRFLIIVDNDGIKIVDFVDMRNLER